MRLQIIQIAERGVPNLERLYLRVLADTNLVNYAVLATTYLNPSSISNQPRHTYWFAPQPVRAGDNVILYSGSGIQQSAITPSGSSNHFYYWNLPKTAWGQTGECAVLFELNEWQTSKYE